VYFRAKLHKLGYASTPTLLIPKGITKYCRAGVVDLWIEQQICHTTTLLQERRAHTELGFALQLELETLQLIYGLQRTPMMYTYNKCKQYVPQVWIHACGKCSLLLLLRGLREEVGLWTRELAQAKWVKHTMEMVGGETGLINLPHSLPLEPGKEYPFATP